jgi:hypothetical protein
MGTFVTEALPGLVVLLLALLHVREWHLLADTRAELREIKTRLRELENQRAAIRLIED